MDKQKQIKEILSNIDSNNDEKSIVLTALEKLAILNPTSDDIQFASLYLHYSKAKKNFFFNVKRKSPISYASHFDSHIKEQYSYPKEKEYTFNKVGPPYGTQWIHDTQVDDIMDKKAEENLEKFNALRKIILPEQRSKEWFDMRFNKITASDGGTVLNANKHEPQYSFIIKKTRGAEFLSNKFCYHGTKFEQIATNIYEYRMNCKVDEFGLLGHPVYNFLGASPDGICSNYKMDQKTKSNLVGRMLEIKCPLVRKINKSGEIKDNICPIYYWVQVQLQLECCDLDECDFWQCKITEYSNRSEFIEDTDSKEPFKSKTFGYEKGCLIQLLPINKMSDVENGKYYETVHNNAKFIYPPNIEMTPYDCDKWLAETLSNYATEYKGYVLDKIIYWKLEESHNELIHRDKEWFANSLPQLEKMWNYVEFFRKNEDKLQMLEKIITIYHRKGAKNDKVMNVVELLYKGNIEEVLSIINTNNELVLKSVKPIDDGCLFSDENEPPKKNNKKIKNNDECLFSDENESPKKIKPSTRQSQKYKKSSIFIKTLKQTDDDTCLFSE